jgi:hypothetical protein
MITKEMFENATPFEKGYHVYMVGCREDQPNVPKEYTPSEEEREEYDRGQRRAIIDVIDAEE